MVLEVTESAGRRRRQGPGRPRTTAHEGFGLSIDDYGTVLLMQQLTRIALPRSRSINPLSRTQPDRNRRRCPQIEPRHGENLKITAVAEGLKRRRTGTCSASSAAISGRVTSRRRWSRAPIRVGRDWKQSGYIGRMQCQRLRTSNRSILAVKGCR